LVEVRPRGALHSFAPLRSKLSQQMDTWPEAPQVCVRPGIDLPPGLSVNAPVPCKDNGVSFWAVGGPSKARIRINDDPQKLLQLPEDFTLAVRFRAAKGEATTPAGSGAAAVKAKTSNYDSLLLGHDNKHWLAIGADQHLCCVNSDTGDVAYLDHQVKGGAWSIVYLQARGSSTVVYTFDEGGFFEAGMFDVALAGGGLRQMGWATNEIYVAEVLVWNRCVPWAEMCLTCPAPLLPEPEPAEPAEALTDRTISGQVVDLHGQGIPDVEVAWLKGKCLTDEDGCFEVTLSEADTDAGDGTDSVGSESTTTTFDFQCAGFGPGVTQARSADTRNPPVQITLRPIAAEATFDASEEGNVMDEKSGSHVKIAPGSLVHLDGSPVEGPISVRLSIIDSTDPASLASMPGDFSAIGKDGAKVHLESLGAAWIGAVDDQGNELKVADENNGVVLNLATEGFCNPEKVGSTPEMWSFDKLSGKWVLMYTPMTIDGELAPSLGTTSAGGGEEYRDDESDDGPKRGKKGKSKSSKGDYRGEAERVRGSFMTPEKFKEKVSSKCRKMISCPVKMGFINCDVETTATANLIQGRVVSNGRPLKSAQLWCFSDEYAGRMSDFTDGDGKFSALLAQFDSSVKIEVITQTPVMDGSKVDVFFESRSWQRSTARKQLERIPGVYLQGKEVDGQSSWERDPQKGEVGVSRIVWCKKRLQWHLFVDGALMFSKDCAEEDALPFGAGWRAATLFGEDEKSVAPPAFSRGVKIEKKKFGPFKTKAAGELVDVGEIVFAV